MRNGGTLRRLREALGLTQAGFASAVGEGLHQPTVSDVERGLARLTGAQAYRIAEVYRDAMDRLGLRLEDLLRP